MSPGEESFLVRETTWGVGLTVAAYTAVLLGFVAMCCEQRARRDKKVKTT